MEKFNNALEHADLDEESRVLVTDEEVRRAMADLDLDIPKAEKADMDNSPVTQEEMNEAMKSLSEPKVHIEKIVDLQPPVDDITSEKESPNASVEALSEPEVQVENIEEFQSPTDEISPEKELSVEHPETKRREEEVHERIEELRQSLEEAGDDSKLNIAVSDGGNNTNGTIDNLSQIGPGGRRWSEWGTSYERMHGNDTVEIFKKAFGTGLSALFNLFRPSAWKKYKKMLSEHNDESLTKKTSFTRDSDGNEKHWTH